MSTADKRFLPSIVPAGKDVHAWCKERLCIKCREGTNNKQFPPGGLDACGWRFLKPGLDDFRSGYSTPIGDQNFIRIQRGFCPPCCCEMKPKNHLTKEQVCFSKENPQQHAHRKHLSEVEYTLTQHPLALYPHFQECMSSELLDQVTSVLDPEMSINSEAASLLINFSRDHADDCAEQNKLEASRSYGGNNTMAPNKRRADDSAVKNPYCHLQVNEKRSKDDTEAASFNEEIRRVTKRLHDWIVCLDRGENDDLTESTMFNLLASAFEIKPAFPKQVRNRRQPWSSAENLHKAAKPNTFLMAPDSLKIHSGKAKVNYGVLSLDSKTEKTRSRSMQYLPNDQEFSVSPRKLNAQLEQSYAAQAYKKFIVNKGLREPEAGNYSTPSTSAVEERPTETVAEENQQPPDIPPSYSKSS